MATEKKKIERITLKGVIKYHHLIKPNTKFNKDGTFSVDILVDPATADGKAMLANLKKRADDVFAAEVKKAPKTNKFKVHYPFSKELDKDEKETGMYVVRAKTNAKNKDGAARLIPLFDAKNAPITTPPRLGRGSLVNVNVTPAAMSMDATKIHGLTLYLNAVQIKELVEYAGQDASSFGFEADEGGWSSEGGSTESDAPFEDGTTPDAAADAGADADF